jgi:hypothetical protein
MRRRENARRPRWRLAALLLLLLSIGILAAAWLSLPALAARLALRHLRALGIEHAALDVPFLSWNRAVVRSVALGDPPTLEIDRVEAHYAPSGLLAGRVDRLEVSDATVQVVFTEQGPSLGPLDRLLAGGDGRGGAGAPALGGIALRRARVLLRSADAVLGELAIEAEAFPETPATSAADLFAALRAELRGLASLDQVRLGATARVDLRGEIRATWSAGAGHLSARDLRVALADEAAPLSLATTLGLEADVSLDGDSLRVSLPECAGVAIEALERGRGVSLHAPIAMCAKTGVHGIEIPLAAQAGAARVRLDLELGSQERLRLRAPGGDPARTWSLDAPRLSVAGGVGGAGDHLSFRLSGRRADLPGYRVAADSLDAHTRVERAEGGDLRVSGGVEASGVRLGRREAPALLPLRLDGSYSLVEGRFEFGARLFDGRGFSLRGEGHHQVAGSRGEARLALEPLRFAPDGRAPGDVFPALARWIPAARGAVSAKARFAWPSERIGTGEVSFEALDLATETLFVDGISGVVKLDEVWPPRTPPGQFLRFRSLRSGISLSDGMLVFALEPGGILDITAAEGLWAGGWLKATGRIDPSAARHEYALELKNIGLAPLAELAEIEGLEVSGQLTGTLPIYVEGESIVIESARLESSATGGTIRYRPAVPPAALARAGSGGTLALDALRDFRFDTLTLDVAGDADEALLVTLRLAGRNPDVSERPIELNFSIRGPLGALASESLAGVWFPQRFVPALVELRALGKRGARPPERK